MAGIKIELEDGTGTWVTYMPIEGVTAYDALDAFQKAAGMFMRSLLQDTAAVKRHLEGEAPSTDLFGFISTNVRVP